MRKLRVYCAGAYSSDNVIGVMDNIRCGLKLSAACAKAGFAVYSPWCDCLLHFQEHFDLQACYDYSLPWLEVSDAVLVVPEGAAQSRGTQAELARAREMEIPVYWTLDALIEYSNGLRDELTFAGEGI